MTQEEIKRMLDGAPLVAPSDAQYRQAFPKGKKKGDKKGGTKRGNNITKVMKSMKGKNAKPATNTKTEKLETLRRMPRRTPRTTMGDATHDKGSIWEPCDRAADSWAQANWNGIWLILLS